MSQLRVIERCRICGNAYLDNIISLGTQHLTGRFRKPEEPQVPAYPLELIKCHEGDGINGCGLVQLRHSAPHGEMFGDGYGYRSGLNRSMVAHLANVAQSIEHKIKPQADDLIVDIGSSDATLLKCFSKGGKIGIDPSARQFQKYYPEGILLIPECFDGKTVHKIGIGAQVVTSIAMFYDLEDPISFARNVSNLLVSGGLWVFEQAYLPSILRNTAYDTICHEHLEYYGVRQIKWICDMAGFQIIDITQDDTNGGSFCVFAKKATGQHCDKVREMVADELALGLNTIEPYCRFVSNIENNRLSIRRFFQDAHFAGEKILGYGASTKGNVLLQYCGIGPDDLPAIADVNEDKFGKLTPGLGIPIISESEARERHPDYFFILPWHFKEEILRRERNYLDGGGAMVFPLPRFHTVRG